VNTLAGSSVSVVKVEYSSLDNRISFTFTYETDVYSFTLRPTTLTLLLTGQISNLSKPNHNIGPWRSLVADRNLQGNLTVTVLSHEATLLKLTFSASDLTLLLTSLD